LSPSAENLLKGVADLGPESDGPLIEEHWAAVHGKYEVSAVLDGLVNEATERVNRRVIAVGRTVGCIQHKPEGSVRERLE
jgi:hypothetical protein